MIRCVECGEEVNPRSRSSCREVRGWEKLRAQGGANAIRLREETGRWAHGWCVDVMALGVGSQQEALF